MTETDRSIDRRECYDHDDYGEVRVMDIEEAVLSISPDDYLERGYQIKFTTAMDADTIDRTQIHREGWTEFWEAVYDGEIGPDGEVVGDAE